MRLAALTDDTLTDLDGAALAVVAPFNPLTLDPAQAATQLPEADLVLGWSGGLGETLFERAFNTWMPAGRAALNAYLNAAEPVLRERGARLLLRTHARHVISDAQAALTLLEERRASPFGVAFDPAACFEPSMLADAQDHLERFFGFAAGRAEVIVLASFHQPKGEDELLRPAVLGDGLLDPALLGRLTRQHAREGAIVAAVGEDAQGQLRRAGLL